MELQPQSFQWIFSVDFLSDWLVWSPCSPRDSQESSPAPQFKSISSSVHNFLLWVVLKYSMKYPLFQSDAWVDNISDKIFFQAESVTQAYLPMLNAFVFSQVCATLGPPGSVHLTAYQSWAPSVSVCPVWLGRQVMGFNMFPRVRAWSQLSGILLSLLGQCTERGRSHQRLQVPSPRQPGHRFSQWGTELTSLASYPQGSSGRSSGLSTLSLVCWNLLKAGCIQNRG